MDKQKSVAKVLSADTKYSYKRKRRLVTDNELSFYHTLRRAINRQYYCILPQVHLSSLFKWDIKGQSYKGAKSKIDRKSVDYVICTLKGLNPICGIELDDKTHNQPDRMKRDKFVNELFRQANLPLIRIPQKHKNDVNRLKANLQTVPLSIHLDFY